MNPDSDNNRQNIPPKRALKFLRWFCREDYLEEIEGDLFEIFESQYEENPKKANRKFIWNVIRYFRPEFIKSFKPFYQLNGTAMLRHNFLITLRTFLRYKMSFFINLSGLSAGLICTLFIFLWVNDELKVDKFHANDQGLYQVMKLYQKGNNESVMDATSGLLASTLRAEVPEIENVVTVETSNNPVVLATEDKSIRVTGISTDYDYFKMFSFELFQRNRDEVLTDKNEILISDEIALKLFNTLDHVLGKSVEINDDRQLFVSGVFKKVPSNSSIQFDFVLPYSALISENPGIHAWGHNYYKTYLTLRDGTKVEKFNEKISSIYQSKSEDVNTDLFLTRYSDRYLYNNIEAGTQAGGRITYVRLFSVVGLLILLIACINFINLSTAHATRRIKEVGLRKIFGANKVSLIGEFLVEAFLLAIFALIISLLVVQLFLPYFNSFSGKAINLNFETDLILYLVTIVLFTTLISGLYPAFYLSRSTIGRTIKDLVFPSSGRSGFRKVLVIAQYTVSIILIISVLVVSQQMNYISKQNLGYDKDNVIIFERDGKVGENMEAFLSEIKNINGVVNASNTAWNFINSRASAGGVDWAGSEPDNNITFEVQQVNYDLIETLGIELLEGRTFSPKYSTDDLAIVFNETAIKTMGIDNPVGKVVNVWGTDREIIGVVKDFHFESMYSKINPLFFIMNPSNCRKVVVKLQQGNERETISKIESLYKKINPKFPFDYNFLDQDYQKVYEAETRINVLSKYFAGMAILISSMGLLGLAVYVSERRIKEIGIRKVNGAKVSQIMQMLNGEFIKWIAVSYIIACPLAYIVANHWLQDFSYKIEISAYVFIVAGCLSLGVSLLTVSWQTYKAANSNLVNCLRDE